MNTTLITGGNRGIGKAIVDTLIKNNHRIINISKTHNTHMKDPKIINYVNDISDIEKTHKLVSTITNQHKIDNVIFNAGITDDSFFHKMSLNTWKNVLNTNLLSVYGVLNPIVNQMRNNNKGNIILLSSVNAHTGAMGQTNYASSKSGLVSLSKSLALENSNKNIFCNVVSPGYTQTDMIDKINIEIKENIKNTIPIKRFAEPEEIANVVLFLTKNKYIQGSNIDVNGGLFMQ